jgi:hypothetical protein
MAFPWAAGWLNGWALTTRSAWARLLTNRIPGAQLQLIDGARHSYFEEFRGVASPLVLKFLHRHPLPE